MVQQVSARVSLWIIHVQHYRRGEYELQYYVKMMCATKINKNKLPLMRKLLLFNGHSVAKIPDVEIKKGKNEYKDIINGDSRSHVNTFFVSRLPTFRGIWYINC